MTAEEARRLGIDHRPQLSGAAAQLAEIDAALRERAAGGPARPRMPSAGTGEGPDLEASARGAAARAAGASAESILEGVAGVLHARRLAILVRQHPPCVPVGDGEARAKGMARIVGKAGVDYLAIGPELPMVAFDLKSSRTRNLELRPHGKPVLPIHQRAELENMRDLGALVGILVLIHVQRGPRWYWLTLAAWDQAVADAKADNRASLGLGVLAGAGVRVCDADHQLDGQRLLAAWREGRR